MMNCGWVSIRLISKFTKVLDESKKKFGVLT